MSKKPIIYRENKKDIEGLLGYRDQDGYLEPGKYTASPRNALDRNFSPEKITRILNSQQDTCLVCVERSAGTSISLIPGDSGRDLVQKCFEKKWNFYFIVPGVAHRFCNVKAEPGEPVEMKFYFFNKYETEFKIEVNDDKTKEKMLFYYQTQVMEALKYFYFYQEIEIDIKTMFNILEGKTVFFNIENIDLLKYIKGYFFEIPAPELKK